MQKFTITFQPLNLTIETEAQSTVLDASRQNRLPLSAPCSGMGQCGNCLVQVIEPAGVPVSEEDRRHLSSSQLEQGYRLACRLLVSSDMTVRLPQAEYTGQSKLALVDLEVPLVPDTGLRKALFTPEESTLKNVKIPLAEALRQTLPPGRAAGPQSLELVKNFSGLVNKTDGDLTLVLERDTLAGVEAGDTREKMYGVAADIGTTTLALFLCDLADGSVLAKAARLNGQAAFGEDVMSRIGLCMEDPQAREKLTSIVQNELSQMAIKACAEAHVEPEQIYRWSVVGNTTMQHLFLGLDPSRLGVSPFLPAVNGSVEFAPRALGLTGSDFATGVFLPVVAGHVGADTVGVALAARLDQCEALTLAVDLGTNGEIVLAERGRMLCSSTAAGPAFEGAKIRMGMRAIAGAIDRFRIEEDLSVHCHVIGEEDTAPQGICGSGLLDILSELLRIGLIDKTGRILGPDELEGSLSQALGHRLSQGRHGQWAFLVKEPGTEKEKISASIPVTISQQDIREIQLACGAISSGIQLMLELAGRKAEQIEAVLLTGAFGNFLHPASAIGSGLIRGVPVQRILTIGNAAGVGARAALCSRAELQRADTLAQRMEFVELAVQPEWNDRFTEAMIFP